MKICISLMLYFIFINSYSFANAQKPRDILSEVCGVVFSEPVTEIKDRFDNLKLTDSRLIKNLYSSIDNQFLVYSNQDIDLGILEITNLKKSFLVFIKVKSKKFGNRIKIDNSFVNAKKNLESLHGKFTKESLNELIYEDSQSSSTTQKILIKFVKGKVSALECHQPVD